MSDRTFSVLLRREGDPPYWLASDTWTTAHGTGRTPTEALFAWLRDMDGRYREFKNLAKADEAGPGILRELGELHRLLGPLS